MAWSYKDYTDNAETVAAKKKREQIEASKPGEFSYADYVESDSVKAAKDALNQQLASKPGAYQSQWQQSLDDTMNKILNREKFSYDLNGDALYQQYKDQYTTQGKMAMMDTMGQAAALTGGYGNSYAQSVGQQAYQGYLQQLNDKVPELYQLALDQYNREGEELYNRYGLFADREDQDYGRYRDTVSDWNAERDYLTGRYDTETDRDYGRYADNRDFSYGQYRDSVSDWQTELNRADSNYFNERDFGYSQYSDDRNLSYTDHRNTVADQQWQTEFDEAMRQYNQNYAYQQEQDKIANKLAQDQLTETIRANKASEAISRSKLSSGSGGNQETSLFGGFTEKEFTDAMRDAAANGNTKDAQALVIAAGNSDAAMEIYDAYFGEGSKPKTYAYGTGANGGWNTYTANKYSWK